MISATEYIQKSLDTNLFFARIMKEHAIFLQAGFVCKDTQLIQQAQNFKQAFNQLLWEATRLANGVVSREAIVAQVFFTSNTLLAEEKTMSLSGIPIDLSLTRAEMALVGGSSNISPQLQGAVSDLNLRALSCIAPFVDFKARVLAGVLSCQLFTWLFPSMLEHIREEALMYQAVLTRLQNGQHPNEVVRAAETETFWNDIMEEHSVFIQHLLDPTAEQLIATATAFANQFKQLEDEARAADQNAPAVRAVTQRSLATTNSLRDFKKQGTDLILSCRLKSLINPLLADHVTREANHYIRLLQELAPLV